MAECKWITNWPGGGAKWATCSSEFAAQVVWDGRCEVKLVKKKDTAKLTRHILRVPDFARPRTLGLPASRAVTMALRISPLDRMRDTQRRVAA